MTLRLVPKVFYSIDVISLFCKYGGVVDAPVMKVAHVQGSQTPLFCLQHPHPVCLFATFVTLQPHVQVVISVHQ